MKGCTTTTVMSRLSDAGRTRTSNPWDTRAPLTKGQAVRDDGMHNNDSDVASDAGRTRTSDPWDTRAPLTKGQAEPADMVVRATCSPMIPKIPSRVELGFTTKPGVEAMNVLNPDLLSPG
jgi:hypothetical protein